MIAGGSIVTFGANAVKRVDTVDAGTAIPARAISTIVNVYQEFKNGRERIYAMICLSYFQYLTVWWGLFIDQKIERKLVEIM